MTVSIGLVPHSPAVQAEEMMEVVRTLLPAASIESFCFLFGARAIAVLQVPYQVAGPTQGSRKYHISQPQVPYEAAAGTI